MIDHLPKDLFSAYDSIIFFDTETTGIDPKSDYVVELSAARFSRDAAGEWVLVRNMSSLITLPEGVSISPEAAKVNGITEEMIINEGQPCEKVMSDFCDLITPSLNKYCIGVAYNAFFDFSFINSEFERLIKAGKFSRDDQGKTLAELRLFDPLLIARHRVRSGDGSRVSHKLGDMLTYYGITDVKNTHRAMGDVEALVSLTDAFYKEKMNPGFGMVDVFPYYEKHGTPENFSAICPRAVFLGDKAIRDNYLTATRRIVDGKVLMVRDYVPSVVRDHVFEYIKNGELKNYEPIYICRKSNHPDDSYLYSVIAQDSRDGSYACWSTWNENTQSLNHGHYSLNSYLDAKKVLNETYFDITESYDPSVVNELDVIDRVADYVMETFGDDNPDLSYARVNMQIANDIENKADTNLAYTSVGAVNEFDLNVSVNIARQSFTVRIDDMIVNHKTFSLPEQMIQDISFDHDTLVSISDADVDRMVTGNLIAQAYDTLLGKDGNFTNEFEKRLYDYNEALTIQQHPATTVDVIKSHIADDPGSKDLCNRLIDLIDKHGDMCDGVPVPYGVHKEAAILLSNCKSYMTCRETDMSAQKKEQEAR